jgi:hypothetical protein
MRRVPLMRASSRPLRGPALSRPRSGMSVVIALFLVSVLGLLVASADRVHGQVGNYWVEYTEGPYLDRLKTLFREYNIKLQHVARRHFPGIEQVIGDVDIFQVSAGESCAAQRCYYALFSTDLGEIPVLTECAFERAGELGHPHRPDGSLFFLFEFACGDTATQIQISRSHFWITSRQKPSR